jgi:LacI family transcriptional regulator
MAKPTMKDVATLAGVDTSTVSRALATDTQHMLSDETVVKVRAAADELGYRPNALARGLRTQNSKTIGMLVPDLTNPFFPPIVRGLEDTLQPRGYTLIVINTDNDAERERAALEKLLDRQVDGLVLATVHLEENGLATTFSNVPSVLVNRRGQGERLSSVVPHEDAAVREVARHLADLGHRHVAHVAGPQDLSTGHDRRHAFAEACIEVGMDDPVVEVADAFRRESGAAACRRLLERETGVTAIFAANDLIAIGCLEVLRSAGLRVPEDISLVGYNDMPLVDMIDPPLTTVQVPQYDMGREAAELLLAELDDEVTVHVRSVQLPSHLVVRSSTAALLA